MIREARTSSRGFSPPPRPRPRLNEKWKSLEEFGGAFFIGIKGGNLFWPITPIGIVSAKRESKFSWWWSFEICGCSPIKKKDFKVEISRDSIRAEPKVADKSSKPLFMECHCCLFKIWLGDFSIRHFIGTEALSAYSTQFQSSSFQSSSTIRILTDGPRTAHGSFRDKISYLISAHKIYVDKNKLKLLS